MSGIRRPSADVDRAVRTVRAMGRRLRARGARISSPSPSPSPSSGAAGRGTARRSDVDRPIAFLHVPKSAGSSVTFALKRALAERRWADVDLDRSIFGPYRELPAPAAVADRVLDDVAGLTGVDAVAGHFALPTLLAHFDAVDVAIVGREPRARLLSLYEFWRSLPAAEHEAQAPWTATQTALDLDLGDWLLDSSIAHQTDNALVRQLLGPHDDVPPADFIEPRRLGRLARQAERAVLDVGWVDVVERGDAMWASLGKRVGRELVRETANVTHDVADGEAPPIAVADLFTERTVRALAARTVGDAVVWRALARRAGVEQPDLVADVSWHRRLGAVVTGAITMTGGSDVVDGDGEYGR